LGDLFAFYIRLVSLLQQAYLRNPFNLLNLRSRSPLAVLSL
jgi:hypothetical protein